jgi:hypothetical protein
MGVFATSAFSAFFVNSGLEFKDVDYQKNKSFPYPHLSMGTPFMGTICPSLI